MRRSLIRTLVGVSAVGAMLGTAQPLGQVPTARSREHVAWIPPGTYTALVLCSNAERRPWAVTIRHGGATVPVIVPPGQNVVIPFQAGWTIEASDEARIVSEHVPFGNIATLNQLSDDERLIISAWAISPDGPVELIYRASRP